MTPCTLKFQASLGDQVRDNLTGATGTITALGMGQTGMASAWVQPRVVDPGRPVPPEFHAYLHNLEAA